MTHGAGTESATTPVAAVERLSFSYGGSRALHEVTLAFHSGEIFVLMGPNGAGKSSLVRCLTGSLRPRGGRVWLAPPRPGLSALGLVPQEVALYPWLTARENCRAFARVAGFDRRSARERVDEALDLASCAGIADLPVARLSGGNRRRANIAAALVTRPRFLILDEPTVGVDLDARHAIAATLRSLRDREMAVLMITHDFAEADGLADRVGFLRDGELVAHGPPDIMVAELFEGRKRVDVLLSGPPLGEQTATLARCGARPTADPTVWTAYLDLRGWDVERFGAVLAASGLHVGELRLREPGLESLYGRFCAAEERRP